ncbi:MAG: phage portal protein [Bacteroidetes bacterium]|nr:phage portal protein [Bacteroidota bacterium]
MGFLTDIVNKRSVPANSWKDALADFISGKSLSPIATNSGAVVTHDNALTVSTVYACVNLYAKLIASLPLITYKRVKPRGKERDPSYYAYDMLRYSPNPEQTAYNFRHLLVTHQKMWGAGIAEIQYNSQGFPVALWPIPAWTVEPYRVDGKNSKYSLWYLVTLPNGDRRKIPAYKTVVIQTLSTGRDSWMSPISLHRETIGLSMAMKEYGAKTFGQGTNPCGVLKHPARFSKEESEESLRKRFSESYEGLGNSHRLMLLEMGMDFQRVGLPPVDAQYLEAQKFGVEEIGRIFSVPLFMVQSTEKSTSWGTGLEEMKDGFFTFSLQPDIVQWEQELTRRVIFSKKHFCEFLSAALLKGKLKERYEAYRIGREMGWLSADDIREIENMNILPNNQGSTYIIPVNMQNSKELLKPSSDDGGEDG